MRPSRLAGLLTLALGAAVMVTGCDTNYYGDSGKTKTTTTTTSTSAPPPPPAYGSSTTTTEQQTYHPQ